ncbi:hypothetical protein M378DRAFT_168221 [Amanita muscaria Koide BX008]|uniref:Methyltransferase type 11 domain-containing protein n=1 Tax=Amanita muscaria (strain Koide BX008) TaxID=946122 RepID=A0A0C2WFX2_AMAMK|nr:hypothetical protein M378DRAFT_168221 [Amanita muscaria Koide BX008]
MATFAQTTFNATIYSSARPTYPGKLFERIFDYHRRSPDAKFSLAIDLGCGTGQATRHLAPFSRILAVDPSEAMLSTARTTFSAPPWKDKVDFAQGSGEDLASIGVEDSSVDLMIAAQSAHWFDWNKVWPETRRVLKKGGCAAFWIYSEFALSSYPSLSPLITQYAQGTDPKTSLGPHFERPGRTILENHLLDVPLPSSVLPPSTSPSHSDPTGCGLGDVERAFFTGTTPPPSFNLPPSTIAPRLGFATRNTPHLPSGVPQVKVEHNPVILLKPMTWLDLMTYLRSWSALHNYFKKYPEDREKETDRRFLEDDLKALEQGKEKENGKLDHAAVEELGIDKGDIAIRFWKDLRERVSEAGGKSGLLDVVGVEWPIAMILVRRM